MNQYIILILLVGGLASSVHAIAADESTDENNQHIEHQQRWGCFLESDAQTRKDKVQESILPLVVIDGETNPASIEERMAKSTTPAFSVAVVQKGKLDWSAAWGHLQTGGAKADCGSLFQAGSIAKPVTLLAALRMQSAGLIDFDKGIDTYLSSYQLPVGKQTKNNPVTFRNLLTHTAGIVRGGYAGYAQNEPMPTDQKIARGEAPSNSRSVEVVNTPGASLAYSGGGYTLIEIALQDQLNKPFEQIMRKWILAPVDMKQADFTVPLPRTHYPHTAHGHQIGGAAITGGWNNYPEQAAAGLWATATDLAMFLLEIHKGYHGKSDFFSQASIRELFSSPINNHAYGFRLMGEGDQVFITHYGGTVGYRAGITLNLQTGDGAVFLANSNNGANLGEEFFSAVSRVYDWPVFRAQKVKRVEHSSADLDSLVGIYSFGQQDWQVSVVRERDSLKLVFPAGNRLPLSMVPIQGRAFEFIHETGVVANFIGENNNMKIQLFGQTGLRQVYVE